MESLMRQGLRQLNWDLHHPCFEDPLALLQGPHWECQLNPAVLEDSQLRGGEECPSASAPYLPVPQVVSSQTELLQLQVLSQETVPGTYTGPAAG